MHGSDSFARMPALGSFAEQPSLAEMLLSFERECEVLFKDELYLVRDNGAVFRRTRPHARRRKLDEIWTFGTLNRHAGYLEINGHRVHRIVATAFHGPGPSAGHVVDHIDTNRQNNRPDNLRWVTRLENILLNPITCARIVLAFGSLEAFFENPGAAQVPNFGWMRSVSKEEAQHSRERLLEWAEKGRVSKGGRLGDWLYKRTPSVARPAGAEGAARAKPADTPSLTAGALQREWRTPTAFPQCPASASAEALTLYRDRLVEGAVFARNRHGESMVVGAAIGPDGSLSVACHTPTGIKDWTHARVFVEGDMFCHVSGGTFFTREGAMKAHCLAIDAPTEAYQGSMDDYC